MWSKHLAVVMGILIAVFMQGVAAQDNYVDQIVAEDASLGAGCNPIAYNSPEFVPVAPDQTWRDKYTGCVGSVFAGSVVCDDLGTPPRRMMACWLLVDQAVEPLPIGCEHFDMLTEDNLFGVDLDYTDQVLALTKESVGGQNLDAWAEMFVPCTEAPLLAPGTFIVAAFDIGETPGDVVFRVKVGEGFGNQVAFIVPTPES